MLDEIFVKAAIYAQLDGVNTITVKHLRLIDTIPNAHRDRSIHEKINQKLLPTTRADKR